MSERNGIEIDYCPQCRGVWLDRGELDKIIDRAAGVDAAAPAASAAPRVDLPRDVPPPQQNGFPPPGYAQPGYAQPGYGRPRWGSNSPSSAPRYGHGQYPHKRKHWLSELFD